MSIDEYRTSVSILGFVWQPTDDNRQQD